MTPQRYRADIDGLRAVAVISVLLYHLDFDMFSGGFIGVDVFFVISGFLITRLIHDEVIATHAFSFSNFYARRARRLFPSLFFTLSLTFVFAFLLFSQQHMQRFSGALVHTVMSTSNFFFWRESGYFDTDAILKPLLHTWSLGIEEQFYLLWPLSLVVLLLKAPKLTPALLVAGGVFSLFLNLSFADGNSAVLTRFLPSIADWFIDGPSTIFYLLPFRVFEFAIGALMVWLIRFQPKHNLALEPLVVIGLGMIAYSIFGFDEDTVFPSVNALVPSIGAALIIYGGTAKYSGRSLANPLAVRIGLISYSLYLIHWPIIVFYRYYKFDEFSMIEQILIFGASILAAALMYAFIEQPFRRGAISPKAWSRGGVGFACAILALFLVLPSANAWANDGWDWRVQNTEPLDYFEVEGTFRRSQGQIQESGLFEKSNVRSHGSVLNDRERVLIIGDSHASQLARFGDYLGSKYNKEFEIYSLQGCPPIFGTHKIYGALNTTNELTTVAKECANQILRWESYVAQGKFDYVVLAARWAWFFEGVTYGKDKTSRDLLIANKNPVFTVEATRTTFVAQLEYTVKKIIESGAEPIIIGPVPNHGKNLEGCDNVPKYLIGGIQIEARCSTIPKGLALGRMSWTNGVILDLADRIDVITLIPTDYFCDTNYDYCRAFFKGTRLTNDGSHINEYGAIYLAKRWEADDSFPFAGSGFSTRQ